MGDLDKTVAKNVRERMETAGLKQTALARKAHISQSHVSRLLNTATSVTIGRLAQVAEALSCEPYELMLDDEQTRRRLIERLLIQPSPIPASEQTAESEQIRPPLVPRRRVSKGSDLRKQITKRNR